MNQIERIPSVIKEKTRNIFNGVKFYFEHEGATPALVERAKNIVSGFQTHIKFEISNGLYTQDKLDAIYKDKTQREQYHKMMSMIRNGGRDSNKAETILRSMEPVQRSGWMLYWQEFYETRWNIKLSSPIVNNS
jgi:hypothetical protein